MPPVKQSALRASGKQERPPSPQSRVRVRHPGQTVPRAPTRHRNSALLPQK